MKTTHLRDDSVIYKRERRLSVLAKDALLENAAQVGSTRSIHLGFRVTREQNLFVTWKVLRDYTAQGEEFPGFVFEVSSAFETLEDAVDYAHSQYNALNVGIL